jgi:hypothetical protein
MSEADSANGAEGVLFNGMAIPPSGWEIRRENPWHLSAAYMYATGSCNNEIAEAHGKSPQAVSNLIRQSFFQNRVLEIMAANRRDIMDLFKAERINTLATLIEMRDNPETPGHTRALCCREILDRSMGRPTQRIEAVGEVTSADPVAEVERLEAEVKRLRDEV